MQASLVSNHSNHLNQPIEEVRFKKTDNISLPPSVIESLNPSNSAKEPEHKPASLPGCVFKLGHLSIGCALVSTVRYIGNIVKAIFGHNKQEQALGSLKCVALISVPIIIYNIGKNALAALKGTINEKIDSFLEIACGVGTLGDEAVTFTGGLESVGLITAKEVMWTTPLFAVSLVLEFAGVVLTVKTMAENSLFRHRFSKQANLNKTADEYTVEDYQKGLDYLRAKKLHERSFFMKHFKSNDKKLLSRLEEIKQEAVEKIQSGNAKEGKALLKITMDTLKGRVTKNIAPGAVLLVAAAIKIIGSALLFTPVAPIGYGVLIAGIVVGFSKLGLDYELNRRFENTMELNGKGIHRNFIFWPATLINWAEKRKKIRIIRLPNEVCSVKA